MTPSVAVFIDYQNMHASGHELYCDFGSPIHECLLDPLLLAQRIVAKRAPGGDLVKVFAYRGRPNPRKEPRLASANDKQFSAWIKDPRVDVVRRDLRYPRDWGEPGCVERPREKGVDVKLAIDVVQTALADTYDVLIMATRDTDMEPVAEMIRDRRLGHLEIAGWDGASRLKVRGIWHHTLDVEDFAAARDTRAYQ